MDALSDIEARISKRKITFIDALNSYRRINEILRLMLNRSKGEANKLSSLEKDVRGFASEANYLLSGLTRLKKMANYALFARVFSLWHMFHLPIFFMMLITAIVHIFSVHMY